jgi:type III secretory pathway component EscR
VIALAEFNRKGEETVVTNQKMTRNKRTKKNKKKIDEEEKEYVPQTKRKKKKKTDEEEKEYLPQAKRKKNRTKGLTNDRFHTMLQTWLLVSLNYRSHFLL